MKPEKRKKRTQFPSVFLAVPFGDFLPRTPTELPFPVTSVSGTTFFACPSRNSLKLLFLTGFLFTARFRGRPAVWYVFTGHLKPNFVSECSQKIDYEREKPYIPALNPPFLLRDFFASVATET